MRRFPPACLAIALLLGACDNMANQPKHLPYEAPRGAPQAKADQTPIPGTVAVEEVSIQPPKLTEALLERGQQRFDIYCAPCHDRVGEGHGMIVQRGFPSPPSYHIDRLRQAPLQHFYDVITNGYGAMYSYAARVAPTDRWAIAAYIRALQASQNARVADISASARERLQ